jgi:hypothetical protein
MRVCASRKLGWEPDVLLLLEHRGSWWKGVEALAAAAYHPRPGSWGYPILSEPSGGTRSEMDA